MGALDKLARSIATCVQHVEGHDLVESVVRLACAFVLHAFEETADDERCDGEAEASFLKPLRLSELAVTYSIVEHCRYADTGALVEGAALIGELEVMMLGEDTGGCYMSIRYHDLLLRYQELLPEPIPRRRHSHRLKGSLPHSILGRPAAQALW
ncbi:hypothetical protein BDZ85DRAFT_246815 [Elsinoe ampelina]|uniref:Uncharacterized protein n=1 Tax=Elsinoe ampelina TaxID=302913 RepID=A0A6A6GKQ4_9PEZI|nr:hypothetical protein BDZ85DRAFT_246815 [Elsinoe ampelina]